MTKRKLLSIVSLTASVLMVGAGLPARADDKPRVRVDQAGDPLPDGAIARLGTIRFRHGGEIENLAFAADGKTLVSCGTDDGVRFWDAATGKEIPRVPEPALFQHMALSPDGKLLALMDRREKPQDGYIAIHDFASGRLLRHFGLSPDCRAKLLFSPDGKILAGFQRDNDIQLWDPATGHHLHTLKGHKGFVWSIAFFADSKTIISGSADKTIRFWDVATGKQLRQIQHNQKVGKIVLSSNGKLLASIDRGDDWRDPDNHIRLWDAASGKEVRRLDMPAKNINSPWLAGFVSLRFAPDGKTLVTGGMDGMLRIWDAATGREIRHFSGFAVEPHELIFAPDGKSLAVVDGYATIRLIRLADGKDLVTCRGHRGGVSSVAVAPDCQAIVTTSYDDTLRFWEPATGRELRQRAVGANAFPTLQPDGRTYLAIGRDHTHRLHDLATGEELAVLRDHQAHFPFVLSPDRKTFASVNAGKMVCLFDLATGAVRHKLMKVERDTPRMFFRADGRTLVVWDDNRNVTVWDASTGKKQRQLTVPYLYGPTPHDRNPAYTVALSPDGRLLAVGLEGLGIKPGILPVLETITGKEIARFTPEADDGAKQMAFSPDGKSLAWAGWRQGTVYLGEIATSGERRHFAGHRGVVGALAFSPDGKMLISGSTDTTALVWDLTGRLASDGKNDKPLSADDLKRLWDALAAEDAATGYRAIQALAADPQHTIPYLRPRLHPVAAADEERLKRLIADLDNEQFAVREEATAELEKIGEAALPAMRKAVENRPALEARRRLERLIEKAQQREKWPPSAERRRLGRSLEVLERAGTGEARRVLAMLAGGAPGAWLTLDARAALERLAKRP